MGAIITGGARQPYVSFVSHAGGAAVRRAPDRTRAVARPPAARIAPPLHTHPPTTYPSRALGLQLFLDSDDLRDLRELLEHVKPSEVLLLLQSTTVLTQPYCLLELLTAIDNGVPIVGVSVVGRHASAGFDAAARLPRQPRPAPRRPLDGASSAERRHRPRRRGVQAVVPLQKVISIPLTRRPRATSPRHDHRHRRGDEPRGTLPLPDKDAWHTSRVADQNILDQTDQ